MNTNILDGLKTVANLMAVSACTAPKAGGADWTQSYVTTDAEKNEIAAMMKKIGETKGEAISKTNKAKGEATRIDWVSDAKSVEIAGLLVLIGIEGRKVVGVNCGGCGFSSCAEMLKNPQLSSDEFDFPGPFCMFRIMDLSIAAGSAVKTAMDNNVDNRMMQKVGVAVLKMGLLKPCNVIIGIPLSATGKNIFFDRQDKSEARKLFSSQSE